MTRYARTRYIPAGSVKVADKSSDAVAYLYTSRKGSPCALVYFGKQSKAVGHHSYRSEGERANSVTRYFESRRAHDARIAKNRADDKAAGPGLVVGDIVNTCWGYDQTNREFFEVVGVSGKMVTLREIACAATETGGPQERVAPQSGAFKGEPIRRLARNGRVRIDDVRSAGKWNTAIVAGVPVGPALSITGYGWGH